MHKVRTDRQLNKEIYDQRINDKLGLMLAGMAKIFVADIVELGELPFRRSAPSFSISHFTLPTLACVGQSYHASSLPP